MKKLLFILSFLAGITQVYCHTSNDGFQYNGVWNETYNHIVIEGDSARYTYIIYMADTIKRKDFRGWSCAGDLRILINSDSCSAQFISTGVGKGRLYYYYDDNPSDSCKCGIKSVSLDVYKHFNPSAPAYDMEISGPSCILEGDTVVYSIKPILTKHLNAGIGVDQYYWNVADTTSQNKPSFVDKLIYNAGDGSSVTFVVGEVTGSEEVIVQVGRENGDNLLVKSLGMAAPKPTITSRCIMHNEDNVLFFVANPQPNVKYNWSCSDDSWTIEVDSVHTDSAYISPANDASASITVMAYYEGNEQCSSSYSTVKVGRLWSPNARIIPEEHTGSPYDMNKEYLFELEGGSGGGLKWTEPRGWIQITKQHTTTDGFDARFKPVNSDSVRLSDVIRVESKMACSGEVQVREYPIFMKPAKVLSISDTSCITPNSIHAFTINAWGEGPKAISYQWKIYAGANCLKDTITNNSALTINATPNMTDIVVTPIGATDEATEYKGDSSRFQLTFSPEDLSDVQASKSCIAYNMPDEVILTVQETDTTQSYGWDIPTPLNLNSSNQRKNQVAIGTNGQEGIYIVKVWGLGSGLCGTSDTTQHIIEIKGDNAAIQYYNTIVPPFNFHFVGNVIQNYEPRTIYSYDWYFFDNGYIVDGLDSNTGGTVNFKSPYDSLQDIANSQQYGLVCIVTYTDNCNKTLVKYGAVPEPLTFPLVHAPVSSPARQRSNNMNNSHSDVFLQPNPTNNELIINITTHSDEVSELYVVDVMGNIVLSNKSFIIGTSCEVSSLPHGQYFVCIKVGDDSYVKSFIKQ